MRGKRNLVVIGNGMAGARTVEEILARAAANSSGSQCLGPNAAATTTAFCSPAFSMAPRAKRPRC
jgi:hypothetical protein